MSNSYLDIAEAVIRYRRQPLKPKEILDDAYLRSVVPPHLHGKTQQKTLQARLSEDIARLREASLFFRTNKATFFLRELIDDPEIPSAYKTEYLARPRRKDLRNERILVFENLDQLNDRSRILEQAALDNIFDEQLYRYLTWPELATDRTLIPVYSFVVVHNGEEILTHHAGQFNEDRHPSKGFRSLGFGSVVRAQDSDILYDAYHGIIGSGVNELVYSLGLSRELTRDARYGAKIKLHFAVVGNDEQFGPHARAIMSYRCPSDFYVSKASLSLNRLSWVKPTIEFSKEIFDADSISLVKSHKLHRILAAK